MNTSLLYFKLHRFPGSLYPVAVRCTSREWQRGLKEGRKVSHTRIGKHIAVDTIFTGCCSVSDRKKLLFRTNVRGGVYNGVEIATSTYKEALRAHVQAVSLHKDSMNFLNRWWWRFVRVYTD